MNGILDFQLSWGNDKRFQRVGTGKQTSDKCGQGLGVKGCTRIELHDHTTFDFNGLPNNHHGMAYLKKIIHSCDKPSCVVCFKKGWATRESGKAEDRFNAASKTYGMPQHIILSIPQADYGLSYEELKAKTMANLEALGCLGGLLIFHMERYHSKREAEIKGGKAGWFVALHFHVLGFIDGGYSCRGCSKSRSECFGCKGFNGVARRLNALEGSSGYGWIFKVKGERKSIFGTCWYQLNHATIIKNEKRSAVTTWFGVVSTRKLKLKEGDRKKRDVCPICQHELIDLVYIGNDTNSPLYQFWVKEWEEPFLDSRGMPNWISKPRCMKD
jgi:hypothetical protein